MIMTVQHKNACSSSHIHCFDCSKCTSRVPVSLSSSRLVGRLDSEAMFNALSAVATLAPPFTDVRLMQSQL